MKTWKPVAVGIGAIAIATATLTPVFRVGRGVRLLPETPAAESGAFDRAQSAALFIGVRKFTHDEMLHVKYAADDAVDLAYVFALDPRVSLVPPEHVVIALSGRPEKEASRKRLEELKQAGATIEDAGPSDLLKLLQKQAATAGKNGILIVSLATHGFSQNGVSYVLGSSSVFQYPETAVPTPRLFDIAAKSEARRSLFLIDACRERIIEGARGTTSAVTAAPLVSRLGRVYGQVVFSAAPAGGYAYDGDGNGVFTKAVIEGLNCGAAKTRGIVTFETLRTFVERYVRKWILQNRNLPVGAATQASMDGDSKNMPLAICEGPRPAPLPGDVAHAEGEGSVVTAFAANGTLLWKRNVNGLVSRAEVADLDGNGGREVIVGASTLTVFDREGTPVWSAEQGMPLRKFLIDDMLKGDRKLQVVALWNDEHSSKSNVAMYASDGQLLGTYEHSGRLEHITIDRPTSHHGRKIIVAGSASVVMLDAKSKPAWAGVLLPSGERIVQLEILDYDNDAKRDIAITTATGNTVFLDFSGKVLNLKKSERVQFRLLPRNGRR